MVVVILLEIAVRVKGPSRRALRPDRYTSIGQASIVAMGERFAVGRVDLGG